MSLRSAMPPTFAWAQKTFQIFPPNREITPVPNEPHRGNQAPWRDQMADKTVIVTGAYQGIGAGLANRFLERGYNIVATSRRVTQSAEIGSSDRLARVDGDIAEPETAKVPGMSEANMAAGRRLRPSGPSKIASISPAVLPCAGRRD